jgi:hypothetical protein
MLHVIGLADIACTCIQLGGASTASPGMMLKFVLLRWARQCRSSRENMGILSIRFTCAFRVRSRFDDPFHITSFTLRCVRGGSSCCYLLARFVCVSSRLSLCRQDSALKLVSSCSWTTALGTARPISCIDQSARDILAVAKRPHVKSTFDREEDSGKTYDYAFNRYLGEVARRGESWCSEAASAGVLLILAYLTLAVSLLFVGFSWPGPLLRFHWAKCVFAPTRAPLIYLQRKASIFPGPSNLKMFVLEVFGLPCKCHRESMLHDIFRKVPCARGLYLTHRVFAVPRCGLSGLRMAVGGCL